MVISITAIHFNGAVVYCFTQFGAKVRLSEQNTKQKGTFFHFCMYFQAEAL